MDSPLPFRCPAARAGDEIDHVLCWHGPGKLPAGLAESDETNPFLRYRRFSRAHAFATAVGVTSEAYREIVRTLDARIAETEGHGFMATPLVAEPDLAQAIGHRGPLWIKDETGNVAGSHKARHLMGVMLHLLTAEHAGLLPRDQRSPLAIATCGNAALAAAVVASAAHWPLAVYIPEDADEGVVRRLTTLGAEVHVCRRDGNAGDPSYRAFQQAVAAGALPFCCQGPDNGLAIEGGQTLVYELLEQLATNPLDRLVIQVGGGALASACYRGLAMAKRLGLLPGLPAIHAVQTAGAYPLARAYGRVVQTLTSHRQEGPSPMASDGNRARWIRDAFDDAEIALALRHVANHRSEYMWPWEEVPRSLAHGILDDETYDWLAVVEAMLITEGFPIVIQEEELAQAHQLASRQSWAHVDHTGIAGLAGLWKLSREGALTEGESAVLLFTGRERNPKVLKKPVHF